MTTDSIYKAVLFDLDGTLLNTLEDMTNCANRVLGRLGFPQHSPEDYKCFVGDGREVLASRIIPSSHRDAITIAEVVNMIDDEYSRHWADTTRPYDGIRELLQALTDRGTKMAVLSNKPDNIAKVMVATMLSYWRFELVIGARPSVPKKPSPVVALHIAQCLKIVPSEFLYLGDTDTDMKTADASGMYPIGVLWGFRTADELLDNGAKALISKPRELLEFR